MDDQSRSTHFRTLFESALQAYENATGIRLAEHTLAHQLQSCHSTESITALLQRQAQAFVEFRGSDRVMKSIKGIASILTRLSTTAHLGDDIGLPFSPAKAILAGFAILLDTANGLTSGYDKLVDLLERIEHFLSRLDIFTRIPRTHPVDEIIVKIMVELLSSLALATNQLKQGRLKFVNKSRGGMDVEAVLQGLDRLTLDQVHTVALQTLEIIYGLVPTMGVVMDDGNASIINDVRKTLEIQHEMATDMNRFRRDKLQQDIRNWLSPPDPWENHNIACGSRHPGTGTWFVQGHILSEWRGSGPSSLLWIHGKPGAGKSVLCSTIIEEIESMWKSGLASLAFFYFDSRDGQKKNLRGLLSSVLFQLCDQSNSYHDVLSTFYSLHRNGAQNPSDDALVRCLMDILNIPGQAPVYLIVDALEECLNSSTSSSSGEQVLLFVEELINAQLPNLRMCVTSRPEADVTVVLEPLTFRFISLHDERGQLEDINNYIKSFVNSNRKMRRWKMEDKQLVIDVLIGRADGMFRWAYCQLDYLSDCLPVRIRHALDELPVTIDETYEQILGGIKSTNWEVARQLFQFVAVSFRPLRAEEVAEFLAFDFTVGPTPKFCGDLRLEDPEEAVLSTCSTLLALVNVEGSQVIQFSHFSAKKFLLSARFAKKCDTISHRYHISMAPAHTVVAQACLGILLHLDESVTKDSLWEFPLAEYAARHWVDHARFEDVSRNVEDGMKQLFDPKKAHFSIWVWIYDPGDPIWNPDRRSETPLQPSETPLHYAALCGLHTLVKFLVIERSQDVNASTIDDNSTPLHRASERGHAEVAHSLLNHNANSDSRNDENWTSLHLASQHGYLEVVLALLEHGTDVNSRDHSKWTPLHEASQNGHLEVVQVLLEWGANVHALDYGGWSPLQLPSRKGHLGVVRVLLEHGVDANTRDNSNWTPLHGASQQGHLEVVRVLLEHGANTDSHDDSNQTPLRLASRAGHLEVVRILLEHGADTDSQDDSDQTPLHLASRAGHLEVVRILLEHGANADSQDDSDQTPLHLASRAGHLEVVRVLLEHGTNIDFQDNSDQTPLHLASRAGHLEIVQLLVEYNASVYMRNNKDLTPFQEASVAGHDNVMQLLLEHGAENTAD